MKTYFAKAYIGIPGGMATYGETLTEKQLAALGEERIHELVKNGCLGVHDAPDPAPVPAAAPVETDEQQAPPEDDGASNAPDEDEEAMEEITMDDLISDAEDAEEPPAPKRSAKKDKKESEAK